MPSIKFILLKIVFSFALAASLLSPETAKSCDIINGSDIIYTHLGGRKYAIKYILYHQCACALSVMPTFTVTCNSTTITTKPQRVSIRDITPVCSSEQMPCGNGGSRLGIEEHIFVDTIDFDKSPFTSFGSCCQVKLRVAQPWGLVSTTTSTTTYGGEAMMDLCNIGKKGNNSPRFSNIAMCFLCCNQPAFINAGTLDLLDNGDSLSYSLAEPLSATFTGVTWLSGWSKTYPLSSYIPSGDKTKIIPTADPPIGFYMDNETGDIIFTPTKCDENGPLCLQIDEWRKDSTGKWKKLGTTRRDMYITVLSCPANNPPKIINKTFKYTVCAGKNICFDVISQDKQFIPPPPQKPNPPDTVKLTWNGGIPGATFKIKDTAAREKVGEFCWTPKKSEASDLPYYFTVTARDNACPRNAITVRSFSVKVNFIAEATRKYDTLTCGKYSCRSIPVNGFRGTPVYSWEISDSIGQFLDKKTYKFKSNNGLKSNKQLDTILFRRGGKYIVHHSINNPPSNCPSEYFDTIVVPPLLEVDLSLGPDTFVCAGTTLRLTAKTLNGVPDYKYQWFAPGHDNKDTFNYIDVSMKTADSTFRIEISDKKGCTAFDTLNIFLKENPRVDMGPDIRICWYDSVSIIPKSKIAWWINPVSNDTMLQGDTLLWQWAYNGNNFSTDTFTRIAQRGIYTVTVKDSLGCNWTDTMKLLVNDTLHPKAGPDQVKCFNDDLVLEASGLDTVKNGKKGTYLWYRGLPKSLPVISTKKQFTFKTQTTNTYLLELQVQEDTLRCYGFDTTFIKVNPLPVIAVCAPQKYCCDYGNVTLGSSLFGTPTGGIWECRQNASYTNNNNFLTPIACDPKKAGIFTLIYTYTDPTTTCINKDSTFFTVNPLPSLQFDGGTICQNAQKVKLKAASPLPVFIKAPVNLNSMTDVQFRVLKSIAKTGGGVCTITDLIVDDDPSLNFDFSLIVSKSVIDLGGSSRDSIQFEITIQDGEGCFNKDSAWFYIIKVPTITFNPFPDLCIDKGVVNLSGLSNVQPVSGFWTVIDSSGFTKNKSLLQIGLDKNNGDTLDTKKLNLQNGPGIYKLRYVDLSSGCYVKRDTLIRINPLPNVSISLSPNTNGSMYCEVDPDVNLNANPGGGIWTSSVAGIISGGKFKPTAVPPSERDKWITLTYTYVHPTTKCDTIKSLQVFVQSKPVIDILTNDTNYCRSNSIDIKLNATFNFTPKISWVHNIDPSRASFENNNQLSNNNPTTYTIRPRSDSTTTVVITAFTDATGVCPFDQNAVIITIHPKPQGKVMIDDADGCIPHTVNFKTLISNEVDTITSTYKWNFGEGSNSIVQNPYKIYTDAGSYPVNLSITSAKGCDTTIGPMTIDVYPLPVADFTPNPNNATTAALPRFRFTNNSTVSTISGSKISSHHWDFGDLNANDDTSSLLNPEHYYSSDTGRYWVTLIVETNHGCKDTIGKPVIVGPDILVYIPNVFTPGLGGLAINDKFNIQASGFNTYHLIIFNRWGEILYKSDRLDEPWDGMYNGEPCPLDAYVYEVRVTDFVDKLYKYSGTVILAK